MKRAGALSALACLLAVTGAAPAAPQHDARRAATASGTGASTSTSTGTGPGASTGTAPAGGASTGAGARTGSLLDSVPQRGELRVCTTGDYAPFTHRNPETGTYRGIDISMARDLASSLDAEPRYVRTTWARMTGDLAAGRCDVGMGGVSVTLERARKVAFSEPTRTDGKTPIVRCEDKDAYRTLRQIDRPGVTVVVNPGGTNEEFARKHIERATLKEHPDNTTIFDEIRHGRADVMMTDASETRYQAKLHPELCSVHPEKPFTFSEKAYAVPRGDAEFREYVDQFVHLAKHDGTYAKYEDAWMK